MATSREQLLPGGMHTIAPTYTVTHRFIWLQTLPSTTFAETIPPPPLVLSGAQVISGESAVFGVSPPPLLNRSTLHEILLRYCLLYMQLGE